MTVITTATDQWRWNKTVDKGSSENKGQKVGKGKKKHNLLQSTIGLVLSHEGCIISQAEVK